MEKSDAKRNDPFASLSVEHHLIGIGYAVVAGYYDFVAGVEAFKYLKVARVLAADAYGYADGVGVLWVCCALTLNTQLPWV